MNSPHHTPGSFLRRIVRLGLCLLLFGWRLLLPIWRRVATRAMLFSLFLGFLGFWFFVICRHNECHITGDEFWKLHPGDEAGLLFVLASVLIYGFRDAGVVSNDEPKERSIWSLRLAHFLTCLRIGSGAGIVLAVMVHWAGQHQAPHKPETGDWIAFFLCVIFMLLVVPRPTRDADVTERVEHLRGTVLKDYESLRDDRKNPPGR